MGDGVLCDKHGCQRPDKTKWSLNSFWYDGHPNSLCYVGASLLYGEVWLEKYSDERKRSDTNVALLVDGDLVEIGKRSAHFRPPRTSWLRNMTLIEFDKLTGYVESSCHRFLGGLVQCNSWYCPNATDWMAVWDHFHSCMWSAGRRQCL